MYREKRKEMRLCTYEAVVRGGHVQRERERDNEDDFQFKYGFILRF